MSLDLSQRIQLGSNINDSSSFVDTDCWLFSVFLYFSLKCYRPDSVPVMPFVDSWRSAWGIFRLLVELSVLCWQAGTYCTVRVEIERLESVAASWLWFVIAKVGCELRAASIFLLSLLRMVDQFTLFPNGHSESFFFFSHQRLFAEGHLC